MGSTNRAVAAAARELLNEGMKTRMKAVEDLSGVMAEHAAAQAAVDRALETREAKAAAVRAVFDRARTAGWSATELRQLGLVPPPAPRRRPEDATTEPTDSGQQQHDTELETKQWPPQPADTAP